MDPSTLNLYGTLKGPLKRHPYGTLKGTLKRLLKEPLIDPQGIMFF